MKLRAVIAIFFFFVSTITAAQTDRKAEIKGLSIGDTQAKLLEKFPDFSCSESSCFIIVDIAANEKCPINHASKNFANHLSDRTKCIDEYSEPLKFGAAPVKAYWINFDKDRLGYMLVSFNNDWYSRVRAALIEKYGEPNEEELEALQNKRGATFENKISIWKFGDDSIKIKKYASDIETASVIMTSKWFADAQIEASKEEAKQDAKNL